jgi:hypothetical protein
MGCARSKPAVNQVAPETTPTPAARKIVGSPAALRPLDVAPEITAAASPVPSDPPEAPPTLSERVAGVIGTISVIDADASTLMENVQQVLDASPDLVEQVTTAVSQLRGELTQSAPGLASALGKCCGFISEVTGTLAPAAMIAGPALVVAQLVLAQFAAYAQSMETAKALRDAVEQFQPTVVRFATTPSLAEKNCKLLQAAGTALISAAKLVNAQLKAKKTVAARAIDFFFAGSHLAKLDEAMKALKDFQVAMAADGAVAAAQGVEKVLSLLAKQDAGRAKVVAEQLEAARAERAKAEVQLASARNEARTKLRASLTRHVLDSNAAEGCV